MPYDEALADRVRRVLEGDDVEEKPMFGGLTFMVGGHMCCGITGSDLMLRLGKEEVQVALSRPHARPMTFTGRPFKNFVLVAREGIATDVALRRWVSLALKFVGGLPPQPAPGDPPAQRRRSDRR